MKNWSSLSYSIAIAEKEKMGGILVDEGYVPSVQYLTTCVEYFTNVVVLKITCTLVDNTVQSTENSIG